MEMFVVGFLVMLGGLAAFALFPVIVAVLKGLLGVLSSSSWRPSSFSR
jgi:hypothetical protein